MRINLNNAIWLAGRQMRDIWTAFLYSAVYFGFLGGVLATDEYWAVEITLPILMFIIIQPSISTRYMTWNLDNEVARHQVFLRSLPIGFDTIIFARLIAMLVAGVINVPFFFLPFWFIGPTWQSFGAFVAWTIFWVGMGLIGAGLALIQEFSLDMREWVKINTVAVVVVIGVLVLMMVLADIRPYRHTVQLAHDSPWMLAIGGLFLGGLALWQCFKLAVKGFRKREFAP